MGTIKDRNGMDPTEEDYIKNRRQEYTEKLYKRDFNDPDNHDRVTYLESHSLECKVKWTLGSIPTNKASGSDEVPVAATAKSLQSCPTLCDPIDSIPPGSPIPGILQARTPEWVAISFSNA